MVKSKKYSIPEISEGVFMVGVKDWNRRLFDALIPLPQGTSYNAYLIKGRDKTALIDTVGPGFHGELLDRVKQTASGDIDYLVMNHAEPDHASAIGTVLNSNPRAVLIATAKGSRMAQVYFQVSEKRIEVVKDGDSRDLGGKTLRFIEAPLLHWPETMFTYSDEGGTLFSCDFFGSHTAFGQYDEDVPDLTTQAKKYFGEIMMPFRRMGQRALQKLEDFDIKVIAPSHGPIYRNPRKILTVYSDWTEGRTSEKALLVYATMWKATETMVEALGETLRSEGVETYLYDLSNADIGEIARELVDSPALVLGTPAVLGGMHPLAANVAYITKMLRPPLKYAAIVSSYGWGGGATREAQAALGVLNLEIVGTVETNGPPAAADYEKLAALGKSLAHKIKE